MRIYRCKFGALRFGLYAHCVVYPDNMLIAYKMSYFTNLSQENEQCSINIRTIRLVGIAPSASGARASISKIRYRRPKGTCDADTVGLVQILVLEF